MRLATAIFILATLTARPLPAIVQAKPEFTFTGEEFVRRYNRSMDNLKVPNRSVYIHNKIERNGEMEFNLIQLIGKRTMFIKLTMNKRTQKVNHILYLGGKDNKYEANSIAAIKIINEISATVMAIENPRMSRTELEKRKGEIGLTKLDKHKSIESRKHNISYQLITAEDLGGLSLIANPVPSTEDDEFEDLEF